MKRVIAVIVAVGICGFYWFGCKKAEVLPVTEELIIEEEAVVTPPSPAPEEGEEGAGTPEKMGE